MISKQNCEKVSILITKALVWKKNAGGQQPTIKTRHSLNQDYFFFHFNMQSELSQDSIARLRLAWLCAGRVG